MKTPLFLVMTATPLAFASLIVALGPLRPAASTNAAGMHPALPRERIEIEPTHRPARAPSEPAHSRTAVEVVFKERPRSQSPRVTLPALDPAAHAPSAPLASDNAPPEEHETESQGVFARAMDDTAPVDATEFGSVPRPDPSSPAH